MFNNIFESGCKGIIYMTIRYNGGLPTKMTAYHTTIGASYRLLGESKPLLLKWQTVNTINCCNICRESRDIPFLKLHIKS